jgi:hypothetical protein
MKKLVLLLSCALVFSCTPFDHPELESVTLDLKLVDGSVKRGVYYLPKGCTLSIRTERGSYWLSYSKSGCFGPECFGTVRNGVIDYEIVSRKNLTP